VVSSSILTLFCYSKKPCRYYRSGDGACPFGNKCFYLHALPTGESIDVGPPPRRPRRQNADGSEPQVVIDLLHGVRERIVFADVQILIINRPSNLLVHLINCNNIAIEL